MGKKGKKGGMFKELERSVRDTARKWRNDPMGELGNAAVFALSGGMAGMDDGKLKEGWVIQSTDEWTGELSGRNAARAAGYETERQIEEAEALTKKMREDELLHRYRTDLGASRGAQAIRDTAAARDTNAARTTNAATLANQKLGSDDQEYLGV